MGRRRKQGPRNPNGQLKPAKRRSPTQIKRAVDAIDKAVLTTDFGSAIGQLRFKNELTDAQVAAGCHFEGFLGFYDRVVGNPRRTTKSPNYIRGLQGEAEEFRCRQCPGNCTSCPVKEGIRRDYDALRNGLTAAEWTAVYHAVLLNEFCPWPQRPALKSGLTKLAVLYGYLPATAVMSAA